MAQVHPSRMGIVPDAPKSASGSASAGADLDKEAELRERLLRRKPSSPRRESVDRDERRSRDSRSQSRNAGRSSISRSRSRSRRRALSGTPPPRRDQGDRGDARNGNSDARRDSRERGYGRRDSSRDRTYSRSQNSRERYYDGRNGDSDRRNERGTDSYRPDPRDRARSPRARRSSPSYDQYRRDANPHDARGLPPGPPPRREDYGGRPGGPPSGYGMPPPGYGGPPGPDGGNGSGPPGGGWRRGPPMAAQGDSAFFETRNEQRKASTLSIWPESPRSPQSDSDEERARKKKSSKHKSSKHKSLRHRSSKHKSSSRKKRRYSDDSDLSDSDDDSDLDSDSEEERRRHKKKHHSSHRSSKHKHKHRGSRKHHRDDDSDRSDASESEDERRRRRKSKSARSGLISDDERAEVNGKGKAKADDAPQIGLPAHDDEAADEWERALKRRKDAGENDEIVGPVLPKTDDGKIDERAYGGALLAGEGSAMAAYLQEGKRIPRRGEIGLSSDQIEAYESAGFVMSGSRHRRMNAVRIRKENQVISAEEKRGILKMQAEEKAKKEAQIVAQFKEMVDTMNPGGR